MIYVKKKEIVMDKFEEKMKEALHEVTNGFEVSGEITERIKEKIRKAETDMSMEKTAK